MTYWHRNRHRDITSWVIVSVQFNWFSLWVEKKYQKTYRLFWFKRFPKDNRPKLTPKLLWSFSLLTTFELFIRNTIVVINKNEKQQNFDIFYDLLLKTKSCDFLWQKVLVFILKNNWIRDWKLNEMIQTFNDFVSLFLRQTINNFH